MLIKLYYLSQDCLKNLLRTKGIISTFILSLLIGTTAFFSINLFLLFHHIHKEMVAALESETDFIAVQMGMAPVVGMLIFKIGIFILSLTLILLTIAYIKKSFKQLLVAQVEDFKVMAFIGESTSQLGLFYTGQVFLFSLVIFTISSLLGSLFFHLSVLETIKLAINSDSVNSFKGNILLLSTTIFSILLYIFLTTFFMVNKKFSSTNFITNS